MFVSCPDWSMIGCNHWRARFKWNIFCCFKFQMNHPCYIPLCLYLSIAGANYLPGYPHSWIHIFHQSLPPPPPSIHPSLAPPSMSVSVLYTLMMGWSMCGCVLCVCRTWRCWRADNELSTYGAAELLGRCYYKVWEFTHTRYTVWIHTGMLGESASWIKAKVCFTPKQCSLEWLIVCTVAYTQKKRQWMLLSL